MNNLIDVYQECQNIDNANHQMQSMIHKYKPMQHRTIDYYVGELLTFVICCAFGSQKFHSVS